METIKNCISAILAYAYAILADLTALLHSAFPRRGFKYVIYPGFWAQTRLYSGQHLLCGACRRRILTYRALVIDVSVECAHCDVLCHLNCQHTVTTNSGYGKMREHICLDCLEID